MATYYARKAGNINATDVWATTPTGTASDLFPTFTASDVLMSNSFIITVNVDAAVSQVRNDTTGGATAGGSFNLLDGVTLTASIFSGVTCVTFSAASPASASIVSSEIKGFGASNAPAVNHSGSGTLNITSTTIIGGNAGSGGVLSAGVLNSSTGTTNITCSGGVTGGSGSQSPGVGNSSTGTINITGNCLGGSNSGAQGVRNVAGGTITITGTAVGSSLNTTAPGATNLSTGTINITRAKGNAYGPGNTSGLEAALGALNSGLGVIEIEELEYGDYGMSPTGGTGIRLKKLGSNVAVFNYVDSGSAKTLVDATQGQMPAEADVRDGVSYASGALTGTCKVPAAASVGFGVPVDATTGTAALTPAAIRSELSVELGRIDAAISSRLAPSGTLATVTNLTNAPASVTPTDIWSHSSRTITGGTVDTLTNAPTVPSASAIADEVRVELATELARIDAPISGAGNAPSASTVATAVRTELATELARVDAAISTRLADADYVAPANSDVAAVKAVTDALVVERLNNTATTAIVGNLIAQANS